MADYTRIRGSKEKIGILLWTADGHPFIADSAAVTISGRYYSEREKRNIHVNPIEKDDCAVDNKEPQSRHQVEYVWDCQTQAGEYTAAFSVRLREGLVVVRQVTITVH